MKVRELMTENVVFVQPDAPLREAARFLTENRVSGLPVVSATGEVVGVLSEADIVAKASGGTGHAGLLSWLFDPEIGEDKVAARTAGEAMSSPAVTIAPTRPIHEAARRMISDGVNRLPVVEDGKLVGILTRADIVRAFTRGDAELAAEIRDDILRRTFWVEPGSVSVTVDDGRVTLTGEVETEADAEMLPIFVSRVPGVISVHPELRARTRVA
ncbi:MAG TPA: CBS domain-containing protein [Gaiellaceae bacterium]|nr:CBS domain-containing protein [Gaiellaceae bacterium]